MLGQVSEHGCVGYNMEGGRGGKVVGKQAELDVLYRVESESKEGIHSS